MDHGDRSRRRRGRTRLKYFARRRGETMWSPSAQKCEPPAPFAAPTLDWSSRFPARFCRSMTLTTRPLSLAIAACVAGGCSVERLTAVEPIDSPTADAAAHGQSPLDATTDAF